jgi:hypothetical protein
MSTVRRPSRRFVPPTYTAGQRVWVADEDSEGTVTEATDACGNTEVRLDSDGVVVACGPQQVRPL